MKVANTRLVVLLITLLVAASLQAGRGDKKKEKNDEFEKLDTLHKCIIIKHNIISDETKLILLNKAHEKNKTKINEKTLNEKISKHHEHFKNNKCEEHKETIKKALEDAKLERNKVKEARKEANKVEKKKTQRKRRYFD